MTQRIRILFVAGILLVGVALSPTKAEIGPCLPDRYGGLLCGEGAGAARVVDGTISPSKRLAFAWRSPGRPPTEEPDADAVESLLIRLSDGAVLWRTEGEYWNIGAYKVNRYEEAAAWSPSSRFVVETADFRWNTEHLRLFAIGTGDKVVVLDLKAIIEPAVRKHLRRIVKNAPDYAFQIFSSGVEGERPRLTIDDRGLIKALVLMTIPKQDPYGKPLARLIFDVTFRVSDRDQPLDAREVSVRRSRVRSEEHTSELQS